MKKMIGLIIFIVGLLILSYPHIARYMNGVSQERVIQTYYEDIEIEGDKKDASIEKTIQKLRECNEEILMHTGDFSDPFVVDAKEDINNKCADVLLDDDVIAVLEVPKLGLKEPIYYGATPEVLDLGVGQLAGSSLPIGGENTHTVLAGHRGLATREMFRHFDKLVEGDNFIIQTITGELTYRISGTKEVEPHETESLVIEPGKDLATLFTCTPFPINNNRLLVYGERVPDKVGSTSEVSKKPSTIKKIEVKLVDTKNIPFIVIGILFIGFVGLFMRRKSLKNK